ncbi:anti-sigma factor domain-containing protein [Clostridium estertheticum]|uniref:anti-sigma-I factor RsgI family protein n=1 Tax=Clostridium estertheticum TaxID=238834 RepID=UPI001C0E5771|nr:anti-sigma factor domain-containing protein [Clostridium estertheticum]MBU3178922.1 anti-sigma factor domain-containing protein [Clostridium estertheticum]
MQKSGKIINIEKNKVYVVTKNNEFVTLKRNVIEPVLGEIYVGEKVKPFALWKYILSLICSLLIVFIIRQLYMNNRYNYSVIVDMNCSLKMDVNASNNVTNVEGVSSGGYKIKQLVNLKDTSLNQSLHLILDESIKQKYLTKAHADDGFKISIFITGNKNKAPINLTEFEKYAETHNFKVLINDNGQAIIN